MQDIRWNDVHVILMMIVLQWAVWTGKKEEAVEEHLSASRFSGTDDVVLTEMRAAHLAGGLFGFRQKPLETDLRRGNGWHLDAFHIAAHYARLGQSDEAPTWLERTYDALVRRVGLQT